MRYRIETDGLGEKKVPAEAYYGVGALRSKETYQITKHGLIRQMIKALANIKKSAAKTNGDLGLIKKEVCNAIILSSEEILNGRLHGQFITDIVQGDSGSSMDVNANEVIANRGNEILGGDKGKYDLVSLEDVGLNQDSFDVVLLAGKLSTVRLTKKLLTEAKKLSNAYSEKIEKLGLSKNDVGTVGELLDSFVINIDRNMKRINTALPSLLEISFKTKDLSEEMSTSYTKRFTKSLSQFAGETLTSPKNVVDNNRNLDSFTYVSSAIKIFSSDLSKAASDLMNLDKKGLISIPQVDQRNRYVVLEMVKQVSFYIMGNDLTISRAIEAGDLDSNIYLPIIFACIYEMCNMIRRTLRTLREQVIDGLSIPQ